VPSNLSHQRAADPGWLSLGGGTWSAPTIESMTAWPTPAALAAVSRLSNVVWKNASEAPSKVGEFVRLTTTSAPFSASGRPRPLSRPRPKALAYFEHNAHRMR
jgi:hypothetical protein